MAIVLNQNLTPNEARDAANGRFFIAGDVNGTPSHDALDFTGESEKFYAHEDKFLDSLTYQPSVVELVESFDDFAASSAAAQAELKEMTAKQLADYDKKRMQNGFAQDPEALEEVIKIDRLLERVSSFQDKASIILRVGANTTASIVEHYDSGVRVIGENVYWINYQKNGTKKFLCGQDEDDKVVYFGRFEQFDELGSRAAGLRDYLALIKDVLSERLVAEG